MDARKQRRQQLARDVVEDVEGADRVERAGRQLELGEVGADELGLGDRGTRTLDLARRDVDACQREAVGEPPRLRRSAAAAELEQPRTRIEAGGEVVLPLAAGVAHDPLPPSGEGLAHDVVAVGDDLRPRVRHGAIVL